MQRRGAIFFSCFTPAKYCSCCRVRGRRVACSRSAAAPGCCCRGLLPARLIGMPGAAAGGRRGCRSARSRSGGGFCADQCGRNMPQVRVSSEVLDPESPFPGPRPANCRLGSSRWFPPRCKQRTAAGALSGVGATTRRQVDRLAAVAEWLPRNVYIRIACVIAAGLFGRPVRSVRWSPSAAKNFL